jgi:hypothetical protein
MSRWISVVLAGWVGACAGPDVAVEVDDPTGGVTTGGGVAATTSSTSDSSDSSATGTGVATDGASDDADTSGFIVMGDAGPPAFQCELSAQDCPRAYKCTPYANDGGAVFNATRCVPLAPDPVGVGEACHWDGIDSGQDDCDADTLCWDTDPRGNGTCAQTCFDEAGMCPPTYSCTYGIPALCKAECIPLLLDACPLGRGCYPINDVFVCAADASGDVGGYGDPCDFINSCDPGHVCVGADAFTECASAVGCCSRVCDTSAPVPDAPCTLPDQVCESWFVAGMAPAGYEDVGVCVLPQ